MANSETALPETRGGDNIPEGVCQMESTNLLFGYLQFGVPLSKACLLFIYLLFLNSKIPSISQNTVAISFPDKFYVLAFFGEWMHGLLF